MKAIVLFFAVVFLPFWSMAQRAKVFNWEGGLFAGVANYSGDINPTESPRLQDTKLAMGVVARAPLTSKLAVRSNLIYGKLIGDDVNYPQRRDRGYRFETDVFELSVIGEFEPFARDRFYADADGNLRMDRLLSPYVFTGIGFAFLSLNPDFSRNNSVGLQPRIREDINAGSNRITPVVPLGAGLKFDISGKYALAIEAGLRLTFSDYIDGISKAANPERDDIYLFSGLSLVRRF